MAKFERSEAAPKKEMERLAARIEQLKNQVTNPYAFTKALGETIVKQTEARFNATKASPAEIKWAPWSERYAKTRKGGDSLLVDISTHESGTEHLKDSFKPQIEAYAVTVSTEVPYAMFLHRGTKHMPARPFVGLSRKNLAELEGVMQDVLNGMIQPKPKRKR
jgi:phage gpG-like protein